MAGFTNDILNADNVNFTGSNPTVGSVTANAQLLIGHAGSPAIQVGDLTSPDNSITFSYSDPDITAIVNRSVVQDLHTAKWIVNQVPNSGGNATSITSALASALPGETIFIMPGTYTEDISLKAGINLSAYNCDAYTPNVIILGKVTASYNGTASISGIQFKTNGANACLAVSGSNTSTLNLINCYINANSNTGITVNAANFSLNFYGCNSISASNNLIFAITTVSNANFYNCALTAGTNDSTIAAGTVNFFRCFTQLFSLTTSSTGSFNVFNSRMSQNNTVFTLAGTGSALIHNSSLFSNTASTISIGAGTSVTITNTSINSSNANVLTGAGSISLADVTFNGSSNGNNVTTQTILKSTPVQTTGIGIGATPGTTSGLTFDGTNFLNNYVTTTSWTPTVIGTGTAGTATYTTQVGRYVRIGPLVFASYNLAWNTGTGTGSLRVSSIPVNILNVSNVRTVTNYQVSSAVTPPANTVCLTSLGAGDVTQTNFLLQSTDSTGNANGIAYKASGGLTSAMWYFVA